MSLSEEARKLLESMQLISRRCDSYATQKNDPYVRHLCDELRPGLDAYQKAIETDRSREIAQDALKGITEVVEKISALSTKGELAIFPSGDESLNNYWRLYTIFRELRYRNQNLE